MRRRCAALCGGCQCHKITDIIWLKLDHLFHLIDLDHVQEFA